MTTATPEKFTIASTRPETPETPSAKKFSPGLLVLVFLLSALIAMAVVLVFCQLRGVSLLTVLVMLSCTGIALALWAAHEILSEVIRANASDEDLGEPSSLFQLLVHEWELLRDGFPSENTLTQRQLFVATLSSVLLFVGAFACVCMEGANSWPKFSPLVDVVIAVTGGALLVKMFSVGHIHFRRVFQIIGEFLHSPKASRIRWALLIAGNLLTIAYGLVAVLPFAAANECSFAFAFLVLSAVPLSVLSFSVVMLLVPALVVLDEIAARTNSN